MGQQDVNAIMRKNITRDEKNGDKSVSKWERNKRYSRSIRNKPRYSDDSFKKWKGSLQMLAQNNQ